MIVEVSAMPGGISSHPTAAHVDTDELLMLGWKVEVTDDWVFIERTNADGEFVRLGLVRRIMPVTGPN